MYCGLCDVELSACENENKSAKMKGKVLSCLHVLCSQCLGNNMKTLPNQGLVIVTCPFCSEVTRKELPSGYLSPNRNETPTISRSSSYDSDASISHVDTTPIVYHHETGFMDIYPQEESFNMDVIYSQVPDDILNAYDDSILAPTYDNIYPQNDTINDSTELDHDLTHHEEYQPVESNTTTKDKHEVSTTMHETVWHEAVVMHIIVNIIVITYVIVVLLYGSDILATNTFIQVKTSAVGRNTTAVLLLAHLLLLESPHSVLSHSITLLHQLNYTDTRLYYSNTHLWLVHSDYFAIISLLSLFSYDTIQSICQPLWHNVTVVLRQLTPHQKLNLVTSLGVTISIGLVAVLVTLWPTEECINHIDTEEQSNMIESDYMRTKSEIPVHDHIEHIPNIAETMLNTDTIESNSRRPVRTSSISGVNPLSRRRSRGQQITPSSESGGNTPAVVDNVGEIEELYKEPTDEEYSNWLREQTLCTYKTHIAQYNDSTVQNEQIEINNSVIQSHSTLLPSDHHQHSTAASREDEALLSNEEVEQADQVSAALTEALLLKRSSSATLLSSASLSATTGQLSEKDTTTSMHPHTGILPTLLHLPQHTAAAEAAVVVSKPAALHSLIEQDRRAYSPLRSLPADVFEDIASSPPPCTTITSTTGTSTGTIVAVEGDVKDCPEAVVPAAVGQASEVCVPAPRLGTPQKGRIGRPPRPLTPLPPSKAVQAEQLAGSMEKSSSGDSGDAKRVSVGEDALVRRRSDRFLDTVTAAGINTTTGSRSDKAIEVESIALPDSANTVPFEQESCSVYVRGEVGAPQTTTLRTEPTTSFLQETGGQVESFPQEIEHMEKNKKLTRGWRSLYAQTPPTAPQPSTRASGNITSPSRTEVGMAHNNSTLHRGYGSFSTQSTYSTAVSAGASLVYVPPPRSAAVVNVPDVPLTTRAGRSSGTGYGTGGSSAYMTSPQSTRAFLHPHTTSSTTTPPSSAAQKSHKRPGRWTDSPHQLRLVDRDWRRAESYLAQYELNPGLRATSAPSSIAKLTRHSNHSSGTGTAKYLPRSDFTFPVFQDSNAIAERCLIAMNTIDKMSLQDTLYEEVQLPLSEERERELECDKSVVSDTTYCESDKDNSAPSEAEDKECIAGKTAVQRSPERKMQYSQYKPFRSPSRLKTAHLRTLKKRRKLLFLQHRQVSPVPPSVSTVAASTDVSDAVVESVKLPAVEGTVSCPVQTSATCTSTTATVPDPAQVVQPTHALPRTGTFRTPRSPRPETTPIVPLGMSDTDRKGLARSLCTDPHYVLSEAYAAALPSTAERVPHSSTEETGQGSTTEGAAVLESKVMVSAEGSVAAAPNELEHAQVGSVDMVNTNGAAKVNDAVTAVTNVFVAQEKTKDEGGGVLVAHSEMLDIHTEVDSTAPSQEVADNAEDVPAEATVHSASASSSQQIATSIPVPTADSDMSATIVATTTAVVVEQSPGNGDSATVAVEDGDGATSEDGEITTTTIIVQQQSDPYASPHTVSVQTNMDDLLLPATSTNATTIDTPQPDEGNTPTGEFSALDLSHIHPTTAEAMQTVSITAGEESIDADPAPLDDSLNASLLLHSPKRLSGPLPTGSKPDCTGTGMRNASTSVSEVSIDSTADVQTSADLAGGSTSTAEEQVSPWKIDLAAHSRQHSGSTSTTSTVSPLSNPPSTPLPSFGHLPITPYNYVSGQSTSVSPVAATLSAIAAGRAGFSTGKGSSATGSAPRSRSRIRASIQSRVHSRLQRTRHSATTGDLFAQAALDSSNEHIDPTTTPMLSTLQDRPPLTLNTREDVDKFECEMHAMYEEFVPGPDGSKSHGTATSTTSRTLMSAKSYSSYLPSSTQIGGNIPKFPGPPVVTPPERLHVQMVTTGTSPIRVLSLPSDHAHGAYEHSYSKPHHCIDTSTKLHSNTGSITAASDTLQEASKPPVPSSAMHRTVAFHGEPDPVPVLLNNSVLGAIEAETSGEHSPRTMFPTKSAPVLPTAASKLPLATESAQQPLKRRQSAMLARPAGELYTLPKAAGAGRRTPAQATALAQLTPAVPNRRHGSSAALKSVSSTMSLASVTTVGTATSTQSARSRATPSSLDCVAHSMDSDSSYVVVVHMNPALATHRCIGKIAKCVCTVLQQCQERQCAVTIAVATPLGAATALTYLYAVLNDKTVSNSSTTSVHALSSSGASVSSTGTTEGEYIVKKRSKPCWFHSGSIRRTTTAALDCTVSERSLRAVLKDLVAVEAPALAHLQAHTVVTAVEARRSFEEHLNSLRVEIKTALSVFGETTDVVVVTDGAGWPFVAPAGLSGASSPAGTGTSTATPTAATTAGGMSPSLAMTEWSAFRASLPQLQFHFVAISSAPSSSTPAIAGGRK